MKFLKLFEQHTIPTELTVDEIEGILLKRGYISVEEINGYGQRMPGSLFVGGIGHINPEYVDKFSENEIDYFNNMSIKRNLRILLTPSAIGLENKAYVISIYKLIDEWYIIQYYHHWGNSKQKNCWFMCDQYDELKMIFKNYLKFNI